MREAPRWFRKELECIAPAGWYPYWFDTYKKWFIVRDVPYKVLGITDYDPITGRNFVVEMIIQDDVGNPAELDRQTLKAIKSMMVSSIKGKPFSYYLRKVREIESPSKIVAKKEYKARAREAGKDLNHMMTKRTWNFPSNPFARA